MMYLGSRERKENQNMSIMSPVFFLMVFILACVYYRVSRQHQWQLLLLGSLIFIGTYQVGYLLFIMLSAFSIWQCGRKMASMDTSGTRDPAVQARKKRLLQGALAFHIGLLVLLKYVIPPIGAAYYELPFALKLITPIGISYYTLMAISYVMDVYWGRIQAEEEYLKVLAYLCYFPQILQGPIGRYGSLSHELFEKEHTFQVKNLKHGIQRILWGILLMTVFADFLSQELPVVSTEMYGLTMFIGFALFGIQLYCNFSGGIHVVLGVSQCFDVTLAENFNQPFFSKSLGDFWRRWHMSLGSWMKDYVFYPLSMSHAASAAKKKMKKRISRKMANRIIMAAADVVVFLLVGVWHGTGMNYVIWGLYNGLILGFSELMADRYASWKGKLRITDETRWWPGFCLVRTFIITTIGWSTDCASTASGTWALVSNLFLLHRTNLGLYNVGAFKLLVLMLVLGMLLAVGILREKHGSALEQLDKLPFWVQVLLWTGVIQLIACLGKFGNSGGLLYAVF